MPVPIDSENRIGAAFGIAHPGKESPEIVRYPASPVPVLLDLLSSVRPNGVSRIKTPYGDPKLFCHPEFRSTVRRLKRELPESSIRVLTGPFIIGDESGQHGLVQLAQEGSLSLYRELHSGYTYGFWVTETEDDGYKAIIERNTGSPLTSLDQRELINLDRMHPEDAYRRCKGMVGVFNQEAAHALEGLKGRPENESSLPIVVTPSRLRDLTQEMGKRRVSDQLQSLGFSSLRRLLQDHTQAAAATI